MPSGNHCLCLFAWIGFFLGDTSSAVMDAELLGKRIQDTFHPTFVRMKDVWNLHLTTHLYRHTSSCGDSRNQGVSSSEDYAFGQLAYAPNLAWTDWTPIGLLLGVAIVQGTSCLCIWALVKDVQNIKRSSTLFFFRIMARWYSEIAWNAEFSFV